MVGQTRDADAWVSHTLEVQREGVRLLAEANDLETAETGSLLTGNEAYAAAYRSARDDLPKTLDSLIGLTRDNPAQQQSLGRLRTLLNEELADVEQTLSLAQAGHKDQALALANSDAGLRRIEALRSELGAFLKREYELLATRRAAANGTRDLQLVFICLSLLVALSLGGWLARSVSRTVRDLRERTGQLEAEVARRRETEDQLRQAQKMEAVGQLAGGIAHDFNNLLTIILGNVEIAQHRLRAASTATARDAPALSSALSKSLLMIERGGRSAVGLTHQLLAFSRRQMLQPARLDLNRIIQSTSELIGRTLGAGIHIETVLAAGLWPAWADAHQMESALINLCVNARDAMPQGGRLTIETGNTHLDEAYVEQFGDVKPGQYVMLSVSDTGAGIPADMLPRVFEPFFTTKRAGEGSGLGLSMVHGFIKQSGGHIRIYSEVGHGTTVKIYLPRLSADTALAAPAARALDAPAVHGAVPGETLLVVEDNDAVRDYARSALTEFGYEVIAVNNLAQAIEKLATSPRVDLVFTDVVLPDGSGRRLAETVKTSAPDIPVLFTTGYTRNAIIHDGRLDPDVHFLAKPYTMQDVARKVRALLDARRSAEGMAGVQRLDSAAQE